MKEIQIRTAREITNPKINDSIIIAEKLLPERIERLYIDLTNNVIGYASVFSSLKETKHTLENNSLALLYAAREINTLGEDEARKREVLKKRCTALKTNRSILKIHENKYIGDLDVILNKMKELLIKIESDGFNVSEIDINEGIVSEFINLRRRCYCIIQDTATVLVSKEQLKPECRNFLYIATKSLELFDLEEIINSNDPNVIKLMRIVLNYLSNYEINYEEAKNINESLKDTKYTVLSNNLQNIISKENKPFSY